MNAEKLRAAAQKIRGIAGAASPGPWVARPVVYGPPEEGWGEPNNFEVYGPHRLPQLEHCVVSHVQYEGGGVDGPDAAHIALWDPIVAEWVAKLLVIEAERGPTNVAFQLARAINGGA